jgi:hypothetical protein
VTQTTAGQLVKDALCTPSCLIAAHYEAITCSCRCGGAYHAQLASVQLQLAPGHAAAARAARHLPGQLALDLDAPERAAQDSLA